MDGEALAESAINKLHDIICRILSARKSENANQELDIARKELLTFESVEIRPLSYRSDDPEVLDEVKRFLKEVGYLTDIVEARAMAVVTKISTSFVE